jgi:hypothetical protein
MNSIAAVMWQKQVYKKIHHKLGLLSEEWEEIQLLKLETENLRKLGKRLLREKFD